jgi:hypothetical protein
MLKLNQNINPCGACKWPDPEVKFKNGTVQVVCPCGAAGKRTNKESEAIEKWNQVNK